VCGRSALRLHNPVRTPRTPECERTRRGGGVRIVPSPVALLRPADAEMLEQQAAGFMLSSAEPSLPFFRPG
jgi:hypothetical protein